MTQASDRESIVNPEQAGLLACNSFCHPSRLRSGYSGQKLLVGYLQLRDSS